MSTTSRDPGAIAMEQQKRLKTLIEAGQSLARIDDLNELLPQLLELAQSVTDAEASSILLYNPERNVLEFALAMNEVLGQTNTDILKRKVELPLGKGIAGWVGRERVSLNVPEAGSDERFNKEADKRTGFTTRNILCVPILRGEDLLGVVQVLNSKSKKSFDHGDQELLESFAGMVAVALDWAMLRNAMRDHLARRPAARACWNTTGFAGDKTCPKLEEYVHCHNCPVFVEAGHGLFNREPPEGYTAEWTETLAREKPEQEAGTVSVVTFRLGSEWLGLSTDHFQRVFEDRPVRSIPHKSNRVLMGLAVAQGEITPCISLFDLLGVEPEEPASRGLRSYKRLICAARNGHTFVFPVDEIRGVHRFHPKELEKVPVTVAKSPTAYCSGIFTREETRKQRNENGEEVKITEVHHVSLLDSELFFNAMKRSLK